MTAPGDFSSGDILTAADMNDLPAGLLGAVSSSADFSLSTTIIDIFDLTFTVASSRKVMIAASVPLYDLFTGSPLFVNNSFQDTNAAGSPTSYYGSSYIALGSTYGQGTWYNVETFAAGTHTVYWVANVNTGTARMNGVASLNRSHQFTIVDLGPA